MRDETSAPLRVRPQLAGLVALLAPEAPPATERSSENETVSRETGPLTAPPGGMVRPSPQTPATTGPAADARSGSANRWAKTSVVAVPGESCCQTTTPSPSASSATAGSSGPPVVVVLTRNGSPAAAPAASNRRA